MHQKSAHALAHARTEGNERDSKRIQRAHVVVRRPASSSPASSSASSTPQARRVLTLLRAWIWVRLRPT